MSGFEKYFISHTLKTGRGYYTGLYWYRLELSSDVIKKPKYKEVVALHIKPYQITAEDLMSITMDLLTMMKQLPTFIKKYQNTMI